MQKTKTKTKTTETFAYQYIPEKYKNSGEEIPEYLQKGILNICFMTANGKLYDPKLVETRCVSYFGKLVAERQMIKIQNNLTKLFRIMLKRYDIHNNIELPDVQEVTIIKNPRISTHTNEILNKVGAIQQITNDPAQSIVLKYLDSTHRFEQILMQKGYSFAISNEDLNKPEQDIQYLLQACLKRRVLSSYHGSDQGHLAFLRIFLHKILTQLTKQGVLLWKKQERQKKKYEEKKKKLQQEYLKKQEEEYEKQQEKYYYAGKKLFTQRIPTFKKKQTEDEKKKQEYEEQMKRDEEEAKRDEEEAEAVVIRHELAFWISLAVRISFTKPDWVCPISLEEINIPTYVATNDDNIESEIVDIVNDNHADPNDMYDYYGSMAYEYSPQIYTPVSVPARTFTPVSVSTPMQTYATVFVPARTFTPLSTGSACFIPSSSRGK